MGGEAALGWKERQQSLAREAAESGTITQRLLRVLGTRCWCLGQCTTAGPSSVGFCGCNLGAGHFILYKLPVATFTTVLRPRLAMGLTSPPICSVNPLSPPDTAC